MEKLIYLASPYTSRDKIQRDISYLLALKACNKFNNLGIPVFSPIVYGHQFAVNCGVPGDYAYWKPLDTAMMNVSSSLLILQIHGWRNSRGIKAEIIEFRCKEKEVGYITMCEVNKLESKEDFEPSATPLVKGV